MTNSSKIEKLPAAPTDTTKGDILYSSAKAATGLVPFAGSAISEVLDQAVGAPAEKRMAAWLSLVEQTVNKLIEEIDGLTPKSLGENTAFVTAVISMSRAAMLTDRVEKLKLLQSVLYTTGSGFVLNEVLRNTFLAAIDRYTPEHVLLLFRCSKVEVLANAFSRYKASPSADTGDDEGKEYAKIEFMAPWILPEASTDVAKELFRDLHQDRLCYGSEGFAYTFYPSRSTSIATARGVEFLRFIYGPVGEPHDQAPT